MRFEPGQILFPKLCPYLNKTHLAKMSGICSTEFPVLTAQGVSGQYLTSFLRSRVLVGITSLLMTGNTLPRLAQSIDKIRAEARNLHAQAQADFEQAKRDIEALILGNS